MVGIECADVLVQASVIKFLLVFLAHAFGETRRTKYIDFELSESILDEDGKREREQRVQFQFW